ncbi:MAG: hypothetical protein NWF11_06450 [Candidatus Bathyarchaeota archaeon]|nr:hypothetical protein [Candidatus Bathyarchaeota archaeon]
MLRPENVEDIAVDFVKKRKKVDDVSVVAKEHKRGVWVVRGTCPIDLHGHPWTEKFELIIDNNGKIKTSNFRLI